MNKHIFWTVPVGVAVGLSLPFLLPAPKPKPALQPAAPVVTVEAFELRRHPKPKPYEEAATDFVGDPVGAAAAGAAETRLANAPDQDPSPFVRKRSARKRRPAPRMSPTNLRRLEDEDNRAWQEANRMLMSERNGA